MRCLFLLLFLSPAAVGGTPWEQPFHRGEILETEGKYAAAAHEFETALAEAELLGPADWRLPLTLHNLGTVERELGLYSESERCYRRAISVWETSHPARRLELAATLNNLAALHLVLGRLDPAGQLYQRSYELRLNALGPAHPLVGASLHGLAQVAQARRQFPEAESLFRQASAVLEAANGAASLAVADVSHNWALLYRDMQQDEPARPLLERAAAIYGEVAPSHPKLAIILRNLADLDASHAEFTQADQLYARSLRICDVSLPPDHPQTGIILQAYARFLFATHRKKEASRIAERARAILAKTARESGAAYTVDASPFLGK